ncbi:HepT-like ribonuclease domain-containing protein [Methylobacterium flocculans]
MLSERGRRALLGIIENIEAAQDFTTDLSFEEFEGNRLRLYGVTRCLEIVSEASRRVGEETRTRGTPTSPGVGLQIQETSTGIDTSVSRQGSYGEPYTSRCRAFSLFVRTNCESASDFRGNLPSSFLLSLIDQ